MTSKQAAVQLAIAQPAFEYLLDTGLITQSEYLEAKKSSEWKRRRALRTPGQVFGWMLSRQLIPSDSIGPRINAFEDRPSELQNDLMGKVLDEACELIGEGDGSIELSFDLAMYVAGMSEGVDEAALRILLEQEMIQPEVFERACSELIAPPAAFAAASSPAAALAWLVESVALLEEKELHALIVRILSEPESALQAQRESIVTDAAQLVESFKAQFSEVTGRAMSLPKMAEAVFRDRVTALIWIGPILWIGWKLLHR